MARLQAQVASLTAKIEAANRELESIFVAGTAAGTGAAEAVEAPDEPEKVPGGTLYSLVIKVSTTTVNGTTATA